MADEMNINKYNAFMGTILICIVYAAISLSILLFSYFTDFGRRFFTDSLKYFITTFVIGTIIIIIIMTILVIDWKPDENKGLKTKEITGVMSCPDYWKNEKQDDIKIDNIISNINPTTDFYVFSNQNYDKIGEESSKLTKNYLKNICKNDNTVRDIPTANQTISGTWDTDTDTKPYSTQLSNGKLQNIEEQVKFTKAMLQMSANDTGTTKVTNTTALKCDQVYPEVLDQLDAQEYADNDFKGKSNKYRCEFAKVCNVPWTSAGC